MHTGSAQPICLQGHPCSHPPHLLRTELQDCTGNISGRNGPARAPVPGSHPLRPVPSETPWGGGRWRVSLPPRQSQPLVMPSQLWKGDIKTTEWRHRGYRKLEPSTPSLETADCPQRAQHPPESLVQSHASEDKELEVLASH